MKPNCNKGIMLRLAILAVLVLVCSAQEQTAVTAAPLSDCPTCVAYSGFIAKPGEDVIMPAGNFYQAKAGTHRAYLIGPNDPTVDLDLFLNKFDPSSRQWLKVAYSATPSANESIVYSSPTAGLYYFRVRSYSGWGSFTLYVDVPIDTSPSTSPSSVPTPSASKNPTTTPVVPTATAVPSKSPTPTATSTPTATATATSKPTATSIPSPVASTSLAPLPSSDTVRVPLSTSTPVYSTTTHPVKNTGFSTQLLGQKKSFPTNAWWENLVIGSGDNSIDALPYMFQATTQGAAVAFTWDMRASSDKYVLVPFISNMMFSFSETISGKKVAAYDELSVTVSYTSTSGGEMRIPLARGSPYITAKYTNLTPVLQTIHAILSINGQNPSVSSSITNNVFEIVLNNGQTWMLYTSSAVTLKISGGVMTFSSKFTGTTRIAAVSGGTAAKSVLNQYSQSVPIAGKTSFTVTKNTASYTFQYQTEGSGDLLMLCLPHHQDQLASPNYAAISYRSMKGLMKGIVGTTWRLQIALSRISWTAGRTLTTAQKTAIKTALVADQNKTPVSPDPYFFGKQLAAMGRLALIADELGETTIASGIRGRMKTQAQQWLVPGKLLYDQTWGGLVTPAGVQDAGADFGNGYYNDHHFHYGYHIYGAAVIAKEDKAWLATYGDAVTTMIRDICNPSTTDTFFTPYRHFDWFVGHSWAAGLFAFGDSRNQESTSEAVNAWYGVYLYGLASNNQNIMDMGRTILALEIASAQKYWHITTKSDVYIDDVFKQNKVVGVLWGNKVDYATFFGADDFFIHCIQMLPFTPMTEALLSVEWVTEEYPVLASRSLNSPTLTDGWRGFIYLDHAVIDPTAAWQEIQTLQGYDDGNSKTNTLYWVATRMGSTDNTQLLPA